MRALLFGLLVCSGCATQQPTPQETKAIQSAEVLEFIEDMDLQADEKTIRERLAIQAGRLADYRNKLNALYCVGDSYCKPQISKTVYNAGRTYLLTIVEHGLKGVEQLRIESEATRILARLESSNAEGKAHQLEIERQRGRIEQARELQVFHVNHVETAQIDIHYLTTAPEEWRESAWR